MTKVIRCREVGFDCDGVLRAESEEELLTAVAEHAKDAHGVEQVSDDMFRKVKSLIRDEEVSGL